MRLELQLEETKGSLNLVDDQMVINILFTTSFPGAGALILQGLA
jgi:hypothetical protein